jgi:hypothetical protein
VVIPALMMRLTMSDVMSKRIMVDFFTKLPHFRSVDVSGAGHMVAGDANVAFTHSVIQFLSEIYPAKQSKFH